MGHTAKDKNMNQYKPSTISLKQGYLHIKRERTTSMFAKPWQQAYFILRREPFIMEEYKDASLKIQKQLHFIGTVRHVGKISTSKSQQFAFEVVMKEKTPLFFACENQMLMNEWISAFEEVMNTLTADNEGDKQTSSVHSPSLITAHSQLERKNSQREMYHVGIVESSLSRSNELYGDYHLMITSARMTLLTGDLTEILSWPFGSVLYCNSQPNINQVILVFGRNCHFGNGKLIFECKQHEVIVKSIETYQLKSPSKGRTSSTERSSAANSSSSISNGSNSLSDKSPLSISYDDNQPVFLSDKKSSNKIIGLLQEEKSRSFSFPDIRECEKPLNTHKKLQHAQPFDNDRNSAGCDASPALSKKIAQIDTAKSENNVLSAAFPEITSEEGYILPNEEQVNTARTQALLEKAGGKREVTSRHIEFPSVSPSHSDNENEPSTYLQIIDSEDNADDPEAKRILNNVTLQLENPVNHPNTIISAYLPHKTKKGVQQESPRHSPRQSPKFNRESRRSSEPVKALKTSFDKDQSKMKHTKKTHSVDCCDSSSTSDLFSRSHNSPQMSAKFPNHQLPAAISYKNKNAFPKQHSISHGNHGSLAKSDKHSANPFGKLESYFLQHHSSSKGSLPLSQSFNGTQNFHSLKRNNASDSVLSSAGTLKSPELDRNTKPKPNKSLSVSSSEDEPPPIPERQSPKQLQHHGQRKLRREPELKEEDEDDIDIECKSDTTDGSRECSSTDSVHSSMNSAETRSDSNLLLPPPLPPKSKLLSCTKSAPIPSREDEEYDKKDNLTRCSSLNSDSICVGDNFNGPVLVRTERSHSDVSDVKIAVDNSELPPELPCRLPVHPLEKKKPISTSEGNLLKPTLPPLR